MAVPQCVIAPSPERDWTEVDAGEVELSRQASGRVFRKHILNYGTLLHPVTGSEINVDQAFVDKLKVNFANNACDIVQVPLANAQNEHDESPDKNVGEVIGIEDDPKAKKVYALVDARKHADDFGKTLLGASAFMHLDYKDSKTNQRVGPTLLHVAVTNRPYVTGLDPYQEIVAASAEYEGEAALVRMSGAADIESSAQEGHVPRKLSEVLAELSADHGVEIPDEFLGEDADADALSAQLSASQDDGSESDAYTELTQRLIAALQGSEVQLSASDITNEDLVAGVAELAHRNVALSGSLDDLTAQVGVLQKARVAAEVDALIDEGRIVPAKRDVYLSMALTNREMFDAVVPDEPIVALSRANNDTERGTSPRPAEHTSRNFDVDAELARLTASDGRNAQYFG